MFLGRSMICVGFHFISFIPLHLGAAIFPPATVSNHVLFVPALRAGECPDDQGETMSTAKAGDGRVVPCGSLSPPLGLMT